MSNKELVKVRHCQIHLSEPARTNAAVASIPLDNPDYTPDTFANSNSAKKRAAFTGPHFHGIGSVQCSDGTVDVHLEDGTVYLYPLSTVARVKVYETTHTPE